MNKAGKAPKLTLALTPTLNWQLTLTLTTSSVLRLDGLRVLVGSVLDRDDDR